MKRTLIMLTTTATLLGGLGTTAIAAPNAPAMTTAAASDQTDPPTLAEAKADLIEQTGTDRVAVVEGSSIFWGAVVTPHNKVVFFVHDYIEGWHRALGQNELPLPDVVGDGGARPVGSLVRGLTHPVFVVRGEFTGNGTGQALAFGHTSETGWGNLVGHGDRLVPMAEPSAAPYQDGLELDIRFQDRRLVTSSMWGPDHSASNAEQTGDPIIRTWSGENWQDHLMMRSEHGGPID